MAIRNAKFKPNEKADCNGVTVTVLEVKGSKVTIRNQFGYTESVKLADLKKRS